MEGGRICGGSLQGGAGEGEAGRDRGQGVGGKQVQRNRQQVSAWRGWGGRL